MNTSHESALFALKLICESQMNDDEIAKEAGLPVRDVQSLRWGLKDTYSYADKNTIIDKSLSDAINAISDLYGETRWDIKDIYFGRGFIDITISRDDGSSEEYMYVNNQLFPYETWETLARSGAFSNRDALENFYDTLKSVDLEDSYIALRDYLDNENYLYAECHPYASTTGSFERAWLQFEERFGYKISGIRKVKEGILYTVTCFHRSLLERDVIRGMDDVYLLCDNGKVVPYYMELATEETDSGVEVTQTLKEIDLSAHPIVSMQDYLSLQFKGDQL